MYLDIIQWYPHDIYKGYHQILDEIIERNETSRQRIGSSVLTKEDVSGPLVEWKLMKLSGQIGNELIRSY